MKTRVSAKKVLECNITCCRKTGRIAVYLSTHGVTILLIMQRFAATAVAIASFASGQLMVQPKKMLYRTHDPLTSEPDPELRRQLALEGFPTFMGVAEADENQQNIVPETGVVRELCC